MTSWFNAPKDGSKFASISLDDKARIEFSEAVARDSENVLYIAANITAMKDLSQLNADKKTVDFPVLAVFKIAKKDYETEYQGKKKEYKASKQSQLIAQKIAEFGFDKPFSGFIDLSMPDAMWETLTTGMHNGKPVEAQYLSLFWSSYLGINEIPALTTFQLSDIPEQKTYSKGGGYKGETEAQKIQARWEFIKSLNPDWKDCTNGIEVAQKIVAMHAEDEDCCAQLKWLISECLR